MQKDTHIPMNINWNNPDVINAYRKEQESFAKTYNQVRESVEENTPAIAARSQFIIKRMSGAALYRLWARLLKHDASRTESAS